MLFCIHHKIPSFTVFTYTWKTLIIYIHIKSEIAQLLFIESPKHISQFTSIDDNRWQFRNLRR